MVRRTGSNGQAANANSYRDIRSFFAAGSPRKRALTASKPSVLTGSPVTEKSASQASNEHSGGNALPKPRKHLAQTSRIHGDKPRDTVIKGSDEEEEDFSDCSLPDLDMLGPAVPRRGGLGTPRARKKLKMGHKSPLTIQPKHKFDFKTLDAHSKRHDVRFDSPKTPKTGKLKRSTITQDVDASPSKARQKLIELAGVKSEEDADKALRAMERAEGSGPRTRWYFFTKESSPHDPTPFPKHGARGPWSFLGKAGTRDRHIMSGMPSSMAASIGLPDELCLWALSMSNTETSAVLRGEYCRLAAADKTQINRLITPRRLAGVFRELGAADHVADETLRPVREARDIYAGRSWTYLRSHLEWLHDIANHLQHESIVYASRTLLRMAVDKVVIENSDVLISHQLALGALVNNVPVDAWDKFCIDMCESLYHGFDKASLRILPLVCMAVTSARLHNLRRRLAIAFFLQDVTLASQHPEEAMSLAMVIARVKDSDLRINPKTDYADLKAQVQLLDMAVDDGSFVADVDDPDQEQDYNAAIDDLVGRLKAIWRGINDTGAANIPRTEAKSVLDWVIQRLTYSVRTRPPPTQSIFDNRGPSSAKKRKQRDFMLKFVHSRKNKKEGDDRNGEDEESSGADDTFMTACAY
ncbi:hypothetical protein CTRI78_v007441 [Colletotrichum trifolii]|uniref:Uncharacterized protein n=1 Tax=Colletotrichum trifolii TaxID=5466 RepID=A0A4R8R698_COLTR|nr:hypothetical protein CTRI78_v007441 [Colletotrichum trifolii]